MRTVTKSEFFFFSPLCVSCRVWKTGGCVRAATCECGDARLHEPLRDTMACPMTPWSTPSTRKSAAFFDTYSSRVTPERSAGHADIRHTRRPEPGRPAPRRTPCTALTWILDCWKTGAISRTKRGSAPRSAIFVSGPPIARLMTTEALGRTRHRGDEERPEDREDDEDLVRDGEPELHADDLRQLAHAIRPSFPRPRPPVAADHLHEDLVQRGETTSNLRTETWPTRRFRRSWGLAPVASSISTQRGKRGTLRTIPEHGISKSIAPSNSTTTVLWP